MSEQQYLTEKEETLARKVLANVNEAARQAADKLGWRMHPRVKELRELAMTDHVKVTLPSGLVTAIIDYQRLEGEKTTLAEFLRDLAFERVSQHHLVHAVVMKPIDWLSYHADYRGVTLIDPDGWDRQNFEEDFAKPITLHEMHQKMALSTSVMT